MINKINVFKGVGFFLRTAAAAVKPTLIISKEDAKKWTLKIRSTLKNGEITATEGVEFNEGHFNYIENWLLLAAFFLLVLLYCLLLYIDSLEGNKRKSTIRIEGDKMIHEQRNLDNGKLENLVTREVVDNRLVSVSKES